MNKPQGYDQISTDISPLKAGGHYCIIKKVDEGKSQSGKDMITVYFDTDVTDIKPHYFMDRYQARKTAHPEQDVKWPGRHWIVTEGEFGPANLKRFVTSVEASNPGFTVQWGNGFAASLVNRKVGIVFREEEFRLSDGSLGVTVRPFRFCNYAEALTQTIPKRKELPAPAPSLYDTYQAFQTQQAQAQPQPQQMTWDSQNAQAAAQAGFMQIPQDALDDSGLPWN